jgi:hypothetical protein
MPVKRHSSNNLENLFKIDSSEWNKIGNMNILIQKSHSAYTSDEIEKKTTPDD